MEGMEHFSQLLLELEEKGVKEHQDGYEKAYGYEIELTL